MNEEINDIIRNLPNFSSAYLFGSRAKGTFTASSDYDICIVISDNDKEIVFKTVTEFMLTHKEFIQPFVLTEEEFNEKMKINVYRTEIIENGIQISRTQP